MSSAQAKVDAELTKPLRLLKLHEALRGIGDEQSAGESRPGPKGTRKEALSGRVLVVEDQPLNREVAHGMLTALGLRVETANDGQQALARLERERFDVVLMDCEMPVMDGLAAVTALRQREGQGPRTPVIALTADATPSGRAACLAAGMDDYLAKPFSREALHNTLAKWLVQRSVVAAAAAAPVAVADEQLLDRATLSALRALPRSGSKDMLSHIGEIYLSDSNRLLDTIEQGLRDGNAPELARAAHAWRSYNGNVGANALALLCRDLERHARAGNLDAARETFTQIQGLHIRVREELQCEMRRSA
jgi:CheY-like chemotaxis protein/HPt (histidine-containing phosphotransfer) domain-containing protein